MFKFSKIGLPASLPPPEFRPRTLPTFVDRPYLSESYFRLIGTLVDKCRELGMNYWLYDEGGFPSGSACGQVLAANPESFARQNIVNSPDTLVTPPRKLDGPRGQAQSRTMQKGGRTGSVRKAGNEGHPLGKHRSAPP